VDGSTIRGNGTLFDGNVIETMSARSVVQLNAMQLTLAPESRAKVYQGRTILEQGASLLRDGKGSVLEAGSLQIAPTAKDAVIQVDVQGPGRIAVSAQSGSALVRNSGGVLVADVRAGMALDFDTQAGASTAVKISGVLELRNGNYFLTDATTHVMSQLQGANLAQFVGKKVDITGSLIPGATPLAGATQMVQATGIQLAPAGAASSAGGAAGGGVAASHAVAIAVIGGIAVGGTVAGLAAVGTFSGESSTSVK
jgi:hypothetical protein